MKRLDAILDNLAAQLIARLEPQLEALLDRQVERVESRLRAVVSEIRDEALEVTAPVKAAAAQLKDATDKAVSVFDVLRSLRR